MISIDKKIITTITTSLLVTGGIICNCDRAQAATITYDFTIDLFSGESFTGEFNFDDSNLTGIGIEALLPTDDGGDVNVTLSIFDQTITEVDDIDFTEGLFPAVNFQDGELVGLDILAAADVGEPEFGGFLVVNDSFSFVTTEYFNSLGAGSLPVEGFTDVRGTVSYQLKATPEPGSILGLFAFGLVSLGLTKQKG